MRRFFPLMVLSLLVSGCIWAVQTDQNRQALRELVERAEKGEPKALYDLARLHDYGYDTIEIDSARSTALYLSAARKGYSPARNYIGFRYYKGNGIEKNIDSALYWIRLAAQDGDVTAASNLGYLLSQAPDINHNYPEALKWIQTASDANIPSALSQLADLKRMGLGCEPDTTTAIRLYEKAAEAGVGDAQLKLLAMMGYRWKELNPDSALSLGIKYYRGSLPITGVDLIERAASFNIPKALALLADAYSKGRGVTYNHDKSIALFKQAAEEGDPSAQFILAELIEFFPDEDNDKTADYWYGKAAEKGVKDSETAYCRLLSLE